MALHKEIFARLQQAKFGKWDQGVCGTVERRSLDYDYVVLSIQPRELPAAARAILDALEAIAKGGISDERIEDARRRFVRNAADLFSSTRGAAVRAVSLAESDLPPEHATRAYQVWAKVTRDEVSAAARARLDRKQMRLVAVFAAPEVKEEVGKLGLGKVTVVRPAAAGGKKP